MKKLDNLIEYMKKYGYHRELVRMLETPEHKKHIECLLCGACSFIDKQKNILSATQDEI